MVSCKVSSAMGPNYTYLCSLCKATIEVSSTTVLTAFLLCIFINAGEEQEERRRLSEC